VIIEQTQQYLFSFDIDLQIKDLQGSHIYKIPVSDRITTTSINTEKILEIVPDPDINLLFSNVSDQSKITGSIISPETE
jgi:hypothetical protein